MKYDEVMTSGTPQVGKKIGSFVCVCFFLVTHVGELKHLRLLHSQMSQVE